MLQRLLRVGVDQLASGYQMGSDELGGELAQRAQL
jgi:hypothetical protein